MRSTGLGDVFDREFRDRDQRIGKLETNVGFIEQSWRSANTVRRELETERAALHKTIDHLFRLLPFLKDVYQLELTGEKHSGDSEDNE